MDNFFPDFDGSCDYSGTCPLWPMFAEMMEERKKRDNFMNRSIDVLGLDNGIPYRLHQDGIHTVGQLCQMSERDLYRVSTFGNGKVAKIKAALAAYDLELAP